MRIELSAMDLGTGPQGLELGVRGFKDNPATAEDCPSQIYLEIYEGKLRVHVWDGSSEDAKTIEVEPLIPLQEDEGRYTNHYLCPNDNTLWDDDWSCMCDDRCPTCNAEIEPYASTDNEDGSEAIHSQEVYDRANAIDDEQHDS